VPDREPAPRGPIRTCVGCRRRRSPDELVRIVAAATTLVIGRNAAGRGAWLCRDDPGCFALAVRRRAFPRALRRPVADAEVEVLGRLLFAPAEQDVRDYGAACAADAGARHQTMKG